MSWLSFVDFTSLFPLDLVSSPQVEVLLLLPAAAVSAPKLKRFFHPEDYAAISLTLLTFCGLLVLLLRSDSDSGLMF